MKARWLLLLLLAGCRNHEPLISPSNETPVTPNPPIIDLPPAPLVSTALLDLIVEFEGYVSPPEAPDDRYSGISLALGYDCAENRPDVIVQDWSKLPSNQPQRLADSHPYRGRVAQAHVREYKDIAISRPIGFEVFTRVDAARTAVLCRRIFPGFDSLRQGARDGLLSLVYNRGSSMVGATRSEMRELPPLVQRKDYSAIADCIRRMKRVWTGTSIQSGMYRRREAESRLVEQL